MARPKLRQRSERIFTAEGHRGSAVSFTRTLVPEPNKAKSTAQLLDVSSTGARLLSRLPVQAKVGDVVHVDFALDGSDYRIKSPARIVRQQNEFVFAVRFIGMRGYRRELINSAISDLVFVKRQAARLASREKMKEFYAKHQRAILISGAVLTVAVTASIISLFV